MNPGRGSLFLGILDGVVLREKLYSYHVCVATLLFNGCVGQGLNQSFKRRCLGLSNWLKRNKNGKKCKRCLTLLFGGCFHG